MALLEIVDGPSKHKLHSAHENLERDEEVSFMVRSSGNVRTFRLHGQPLVLGRETRRLELVHITFLVDESGFRRLEGNYHYDSRSGELNCPIKDPLVQWLGLEPAVEKRLIHHGLVIASALTAHTELELCHKLLDERHALSPRSEYALQAVRSFLRLRARLEGLGLDARFQGKRMTEEELLKTFERPCFS